MRVFAHETPCKQADSHDEHRERKELSHRAPGSEEVAKLHIGQPHEFDENAEDAVEHEEGPEEEAARTWRIRLARQREKHEEDDKALKQRLVELGRMVHDPRSGEVNADGQIRRGTIELAVHEVRAAAEEESHGNGTRDEIGKREEGHVVYARVDETGDDNANKPAVKGHAAIRNREDLERMRKVVSISIEEAISETRADDDAKRAVADEDKRVVGAEAQLPMLGIEVHDEARANEARDVGEPVPADAQRADAEKDRVDGMIQLV